jgi:hypothetical protein
MSKKKPPPQDLGREDERRAQLQKALRELNIRNRGFWEAEMKKFTDHITKRPADAKIATEMFADEFARVNAALLGINVTDGQRAHIAFKLGKGMEAHVAILAKSRSADKSAAASAPRGPRNPSLNKCVEDILLEAKKATKSLSWKQVQKEVGKRLGQAMADKVNASYLTPIRKRLK